ncbi:LysM peptidoglycan-binding domain-containing protein [Weissella diestrammenae]|uniref:LysM peptidoglycan-binding domain-containing protein n=1 Tax=Weissella diestrammenae TaxID=1162633 RepID=A0A7G9T4Z5_9LACO|nr:CAP domain-containing protein [Weissella diestrammenae]MCM0582892.1 LysM peptidoglycan-binding domain-containing protein [Weissella diestrammenae]QNN75170.1 LysM peptidoglycan-binding domain-containing protein [Weissella diestrammenae]
MADKKKIALGVVGALGVAATTQIPAVQAAMENLTQSTDNQAINQATSTSAVKETTSKDKGIKTTESVVLSTAAKAVTAAVQIATSEGTIVAAPASAVSDSDSSAQSVASSEATPLTPAESAAVESAQPAALKAGETKYTVADGDTLGSIAASFGLSVEDVIAVNPDIDATALQIGQVIMLPGANSSSAPAQSSSAPAQSSSAPAASSSAPAASSSAPAASSSAPAASSSAPAQSSSAPSTTTPADGLSSAQKATFDALNVLRASKGLKAVTWDAGLAATAQQRANLVNSTGSIPNDHWSWAAGPEVIAIQWAAGAPVINAWNIDDASVGMITDNLGHRRWLLSPDTTKVGFAVSGDVIVGISNGTNFSNI